MPHDLDSLHKPLLPHQTAQAHTHTYTTNSSTMNLTLLYCVYAGGKRHRIHLPNTGSMHTHTCRVRMHARYDNASDQAVR